MDAKVLLTATVVSTCGICSCTAFESKTKASESSITLSFYNPPTSGSLLVTVAHLESAPAPHSTQPADSQPLGDFRSHSSFKTKLPPGIYEFGVRVQDADEVATHVTLPDDPACPTQVVEIGEESSNLQFTLCEAPALPRRVNVVVSEPLSDAFADTFLGQPWPKAKGEALALDLLPWFLSGTSHSLHLANYTTSGRMGAFVGEAFWSLSSRADLTSRGTVVTLGSVLTTPAADEALVTDVASLARAMPSLQLQAARNVVVVETPDCRMLTSLAPDTTALPGVAGHSLSCGEMRRAFPACHENSDRLNVAGMVVTRFEPGRHELAGDCTHLNPLGQRRLASTVFAALRAAEAPSNGSR